MIKRIIQLQEYLMSEFLPFSRPAMRQEELVAVSEVLQSGLITTGPKSQALEQALFQSCCSFI